MASVSANIPSFPEMLRVSVLIVMLPPSPLLVEPITTVAVIWESSPMSTVLASMVMSPEFPAPVVSVMRLVLWSRLRVLAWMFMVPALPAFSLVSVLAWSLLLLVSRMSCSVSKVMLPALPWALVVLRMSVLLRVMLPWL